MTRSTGWPTISSARSATVRSPSGIVPWWTPSRRTVMSSAVRADLVQAMTDPEDRLPLIGQPAQRGQQPGDIGSRQGGGRLVQHEHGFARVDLVLQRAADREQGAGGRAEPAGRFLRRDVEPEIVEHALGASVLPPPPDAAARSELELRAQREVLGDGQLQEDRHLLVDEPEAETARDGRRQIADPGLGPPAAHRSRDGAARLGPDDPGQHLDQGALAGAVAAEQRVDPAAAHGEAHIGEGSSRSVILGDSG